MRSTLCHSLPSLSMQGPYAWIGYTWSGCTDSGYPAGCDDRCDPSNPKWPACKPCRFPKSLDAHPFPRPAALDVDYGEPAKARDADGQETDADEYCHETAPNSGVFVREYTKASVQLDCGAFEAKITMKS